MIIDISINQIDEDYEWCFSIKDCQNEIISMKSNVLFADENEALEDLLTYLGDIETAIKEAENIIIERIGVDDDGD